MILTRNCNLKCNYCYEGKQIESRMSFETAKKTIDYIKPKNITLFGGEPLLETDLLLQILEYATPKSIQCGIITNGTLITNQMLEKLKGYNMGWCISLDGHELSNNMHRSKFHSVMSGVDLLKKYDKVISVRATITPSNLKYLSENYQFFLNNDILSVQFQWVSGMEFSKEDYKLFETETKKVKKIYDENKSRGLKLIFGHFNRATKFCGYGSEIMAVDTNGDIYPCHRAIFIPQTLMGNVYDGLKPTLYQKYRHIDRSDLKCMDCLIHSKCSGTCYVDNFQSTGNFFFPNPTSCVFQRIIYGVFNGNIL